MNVNVIINKIFAMFKYSFVFLQLAVVGFNMLGVYCLTNDQEKDIIEALKPVVMDCIEECGLTEADLKREKPGEMNPCVKKCILKKFGVLTESGKYDREALKQQLISVTDNEQEATKIQAAMDECFKGKEDVLKNDKDEAKRVDIIFECLQNMN